jgi:hypothetical protein
MRRPARRQRRHGAQVAGTLPGRGRGRSDGQVLAPGAPRRAPSRHTWHWPSSSCGAGSSCRREIASAMGVSKATVSRVLRRAGLSSSERSAARRARAALRARAPRRAAAHRHQEARPLRCAGRPPHHRRPRDSADAGIGWEHVFVAIDDHSRIAFTQDVPRREAGQRRGLPARPRSTTRGCGCASSGCSRTTAGLPLSGLRQACLELGIAQKFTRRLPPSDQRQGRTLHPVGAARVGLRARLRELRTTPRRLARSGTISTTGIDPITASIFRCFPLCLGHRRRRRSSRGTD